MLPSESQMPYTSAAAKTDSFIEYGFLGSDGGA